MPDNLILTIESILSQKIVRKQPIGGGCIADNYLLQTDEGNKYFLKTGNHNQMFICEANSLQEIQKSNTIRVPQVIKCTTDFLLIEYINPGHKDDLFFFRFGKMLAKMHQYQHSAFGFFENNFIGTTPQINIVVPPKTPVSWTEFYFENRLLYQYKLAEKNTLVSIILKSNFIKLERKIREILDEVKELPSLLHGDLWSGNYLCDTQSQPVLIDPAVYYGHRETDLAMTKLFGGFPSSFYEGYKETFPLSEKWEYRENIYKLYHVLNHLNLFGTGYLHEAEYLIQYYI